MNEAMPHLVWKEQDGETVEWFYGASWELNAFWMNDLKGSPTREEAIQSYKDRKANKYMELMESIWTDT